VDIQAFLGKDERIGLSKKNQFGIYSTINVADVEKIRYYRSPVILKGAIIAHLNKAGAINSNRLHTARAESQPVLYI
jgi:hypothetical protein